MARMPNSDFIADVNLHTFLWIVWVNHIPTIRWEWKKATSFILFDVDTATGELHFEGNNWIRAKI